MKKHSTKNGPITAIKYVTQAVYIIIMKKSASSLMVFLLLLYSAMQKEIYIKFGKNHLPNFIKDKRLILSIMFSHFKCNFVFDQLNQDLLRYLSL